MKKQDLKSLKLTKMTISKVAHQTVGGVFRTADCYSVQICPVDPITDHTLEPIPVDPSLASVCFCMSQIC